MTNLLSEYTDSAATNDSTWAIIGDNPDDFWRSNVGDAGRREETDLRERRTLITARAV